MPTKPRPSPMPPATRATSPGWRDPRLWVGVALVAGSVVAGARVMDTADQSTPVWAAARSLPPGHQVTAADLKVAHIRFVDPDSQQRYLLVAEELPVDLTLEASLEADELVPASVLGAASEEDTRHVALPLPPDRVPPGLQAGSAVDVWVVEEGPDGKEKSRLALTEVQVVAAPELPESFASGGGPRSIVVAIPTSELTAISRILSASARDAVQVTARG